MKKCHLLLLCNTLKELYTSGTTLSEMINWTPLSNKLRKIWPTTPRSHFIRSRSYFRRSISKDCNLRSSFNAKIAKVTKYRTTDLWAPDLWDWQGCQGRSGRPRVQRRKCPRSSNSLGPANTPYYTSIYFFNNPLTIVVNIDLLTFGMYLTNFIITIDVK